MAASIDGNMASKFLKHRYLIHFAHDHVDFKLQEIRSICEIFKINISWDSSPNSKERPFLVVNLEDEDAVRKILSRSILTRAIYHLWAQGNTHEELYSSMKNIPEEILQPFRHNTFSFKICMDAFNKTLLAKQKVDRIQDLPWDVLRLGGKVDLKNPDEKFLLMEDYEFKPEGRVPKEDPHTIYFGRLIGEAQRDVIKKYDLKKRYFIGNTSMDAELSLLMSNIAKVKENDLVMDPFVGTGSILVACAHHKAYVMGSDIDYLLLYGKARPSRAKEKKRKQDESVQTNLRHYGLAQYYIDIMVADSSRQSLLCRDSIFDAIVTDPPYGIREKTEKIGSTKETVVLSEDHKIGHVPQKITYQISEIYTDLLNYAAKFLRKGGRLVYWIPVYKEDYHEDNIPTHPCLRQVGNCEQSLNVSTSRRLITMEKIKEPSSEGQEATIKINHYEDRNFHQKYFNKFGNNVSASGDSKTECHCGLERASSVQDACGHCKEANTDLPSVHADFRALSINSGDSSNLECPRRSMNSSPNT